MKKMLMFFNVILLMLPVMALADFVDNGDGTVTDTDTGLMWEQNPVSDDYTWEEALSYCEALVLATHEDWRLPTAKELASLADLTGYNPAIDSVLSPYTDSSRYWTSTSNDGNSNAAWVIGFRYGFLATHAKTNYTGNRVRAVRSTAVTPELWPVPDTGQTDGYTGTYGEDNDYVINTPSYTKLDDSCVELPDGAADWSMVRDDVTGLVWEAKHGMNGTADYDDPNDADNTYTWYDGATGTPGAGTDTQDFIAALNAAGYGGYANWRMPTVRELLTIVDFGRNDPAVSATFFAATASARYWSSLSYAPNADYSWPVDFNDGTATNLVLASNFYHVRAVKDDCSGGSGTTTVVDPTTTTSVAETTTTVVDPTTTTSAAETTTTVVDPTTTTSAAETTTTVVDPTTTTSIEPVTTTSVVPVTTTSVVPVTTTSVVPVTTTSVEPVTTTTAVEPSTTTTAEPADTTTTTTACPASAVLGQGSPDLDNLRDFRDSTLARSALGRRLIAIYYAHAGRVNAALERSPALRRFARMVLEAIAPVLGSKEGG